MRAILIVDAAGALVEMGGITLLERALRILGRVGYTDATVVPAPADAARIVHALGAAPAARRAGLRVSIRTRAGAAPLSVADLREVWPRADGPGGDERAPVLVLLPWHGYTDGRLLAALDRDAPATLADSEPPPELLAMLAPPAHGRAHSGAAAALTSAWLSQCSPQADLGRTIDEAVAAGQLRVVDAAREPDYVQAMKRCVRPLWFPPPSEEHVARAERLLLAQAGKGALDVPALVHRPIEDFLVRHLARTPITPNQVTFAGVLLGLLAAGLFACGRLASGLIVALAVGVSDGVDGKLARYRVETSPAGAREHLADYAVELSWWAALAFHLQRSGTLPEAFACLGVLVGSDLLDRMAQRTVKLRFGRMLDDFSAFDRVVRRVGGRRNVYVWVLAAGLLLGAPAAAYKVVAAWGLATALVHAGRALWLRLRVCP